MNREAYLRQLAEKLRHLPKDEYERAMSYYVEFFDDAGPENEAQVIADLGTPGEVATQIIADVAMKRMDDVEKTARKPFSTIWMIILAVFAAPLAVPLGAALLLTCGAVMLAVCLGAFSVLLASVAALGGGVVSFVAGFILLFSQPLNGITNIGLGLIAIGGGILIGLLAVWIVKWVYRGLRVIFRRIIRKGKSDEEV